MKHERFPSFFSAVAIANIVAITALAIAIFYNSTQVKIQSKTLDAQERIASAEYMLKLSDELAMPKYDAITTAIQGGTEYTPIVSKGASHIFTDTELEDYMGNFETIGDLIQEGVIDKDMAYQEFSYDVTKAWCNMDVQKEINSDRASEPGEAGQQAYWNGFQSLATYFMQKDHYTCADYDKEVE
jgi:hypothetical protein